MDVVCTDKKPSGGPLKTYRVGTTFLHNGRVYLKLSLCSGGGRCWAFNLVDDELVQVMVDIEVIPVKAYLSYEGYS